MKQWSLWTAEGAVAIQVAKVGYIENGKKGISLFKKN